MDTARAQLPPQLVRLLEGGERRVGLLAALAALAGGDHDRLEQQRLPALPPPSHIDIKRVSAATAKVLRRRLIGLTAACRHVCLSPHATHWPQ